MIKINFRHSRSAKMRSVLKLTERFNELTILESGYCLDVELKEIFEKWQWFAEIYTTVVDWAGTTVTVREMTYHDRKDQMKIFYAVQQAKSNQINNEMFWLVQTYRVYQGKEIFNRKLQKINDELMAKMLDSIYGIDIQNN